jgi:hypothetical protein
VCALCGIALSPGTEAIWDRTAKTATCLACAPAEEIAIDAGTPGASAAAEGERRRNRRVADARRRYGDHAAAVAEKVTERDPSLESWAKGSAGEGRLAAFIAREVGDRVIPLHDRLIPGTRRNIDHIWVAPSGVWVVDAKAYKGKVVKRDVGPFWRAENKVYVGGRDRTGLAAGVESQIEAVLAALGPDSAVKGVEIHAVLCFLGSDWRRLNFPFQVGTVWIMYPGALRKRLTKDGAVTREQMERIARRLDLSLPRASA